MTGKLEHDPRVFVDFNAARSDGTIVASERYAFTKPAVGEWVVLQDLDGNECEALVDSIEGAAIRCRLEWRSWRHGSPEWAYQHVEPVRFAGDAAAAC